MVAGACTHVVTRSRKAAFSAYFDLGWDVATIHRQLMKVYSRRQVQRLVKEFKKNYSWEAPRPNKSGPKKKLCPLALSALSEMLEEDPTLSEAIEVCTGAPCVFRGVFEEAWCAVARCLCAVSLFVICL